MTDRRAQRPPKNRRMPKPPKKLHQKRRASGIKRRPFLGSEALGAAVAGTLAGLIAAGLYYAAGQGCLWLRGPGGCGGIGLFSTIALLMIAGAVGAGLLWLFHQRDPVSTSYLGIGLMAMVVMLSVMRQLNNLWMVAFIPALTAGCYLTAWWLTSIIIREEVD